MSKSYTNYNKKDMAILKETTKMGDRNINPLDSEHIKQFAADLPDANTDGLRGKRRVIFDRHASDDGKQHRFHIASTIEDHDYGKVPKHGEVPWPEINHVKPFLLLAKEEEKEKEEKLKIIYRVIT